MRNPAITLSAYALSYAAEDMKRTLLIKYSVVAAVTVVGALFDAAALAFVVAQASVLIWVAYLANNTALADRIGDLAFDMEDARNARRSTLCA